MTDDLRAQIRRALAEADDYDFDSLEPHDYQRHADKILALIQSGADELVRSDRQLRAAQIERDGLRELLTKTTRVANAEAQTRQLLAARLAEHDNAINWETSCLSCARILGSCYAETTRADQAEAAVERVRDWLSEWGPQLPDGARSTLDRALGGPQDRSTAAAIDETYCYEPLNCRCGHGAEYHGPEAGCIECRCAATLIQACDHRNPKRLGARPGDLSLWCACGAQVFPGLRTTPNNPPASSNTANNPKEQA